MQGPTGGVEVTELPALSWQVDRQREVEILRRQGVTPSAENGYVAFCLRGTVQLAAVREALTRLVASHEILRITFSARSMRQQLAAAPTASAHLDVVELSTLPSTERERTALSELGARTRRWFDWSVGPLWHATLISISSEQHYLCLIVDHLLVDERSLTILADDFWASYEAALGGVVDDSRGSDSGYSRWVLAEASRLGGPAFQEATAFWRSQLSGIGLSTGLALAGQLRTRTASFEAGRHRVAIQAEIVTAVSELARALKATEFCVLLGALSTVLSHYSTARNFGMKISISRRDTTALRRVAGPLTNSCILPIRTDVEDTRFSDHVRQIKQDWIDCIPHVIPSRLLREALIAEGMDNVVPAPELLFNWIQETPIAVRRLPLLEVEALALGQNWKCDSLIFSIRRTARAGPMELSISYPTDVYREETIAELAAGLVHVLVEATREPDRPLISIMTRAGS
jgi:Condensation domain